MSTLAQLIDRTYREYLRPVNRSDYVRKNADGSNWYM
jgi:hypothetical protein